MNNDLRDDVISAALDGERVDVEALRRALATEDGRATLAAFVLLRAATASDNLAPARAISRVAVYAPRPSPARMLAGARARLAWAASIAILAVAGSFWFGTTLRPPVASLTLTAPLTPSVQPVVVPAADGLFGGCPPASRPHSTGGGQLRAAVARPPAPTRVLRFVPGVDWISAPE